MHQLLLFLRKFDIQPFLDIKNITKIGNRYYISTKDIDEYTAKIKKKPYAKGVYLGAYKKSLKIFFPSPYLLHLISKKTKNIITINDKAAWLFICGRDVFEDSVQEHSRIVLRKLKTRAQSKKDVFVVIENKERNILGYGKINPIKDQVSIKNIFDIGDFLRRELSTEH